MNTQAIFKRHDMDQTLLLPPGKYVVRIEDDVVLEAEGLRSLMDLPRKVMRLEELLVVVRKI